MKKNTYWVISILSILAFSTSVILFLWKQTLWDFDKPIKAETWGYYGGFVGGILSIVSIILLIRTLQEQRRSSKSAQLNDIFWGLLAHLQREVADLNTTAEGGQYTNKDFFEELLRELQMKFSPQKKDKNSGSVVLAYFNLYAEYPRLAPYFRQLYRICEVIDKSKLTGIEKAQYIKILRAQLTGSELLLLRYNAQTPHGKNFTHYINEYNLLKHLPTFELLEFKSWWGNMANNYTERLKVSVFVDTLRHRIKELLREAKSTTDFTHWGWKCTITREDDKKIDIHIKKVSKQWTNAFSTLTPTQRIQLLQSILIEIFCNSNFGVKCPQKNLIINPIEGSDKNSIHCTIEAQESQTLYQSFQRLSQINHP